MTVNKNCNPFVKEKLFKGLSVKAWRTATEIAGIGGLQSKNIYSNVGVLIRDGVVESKMQGRQRVYRLTGNDGIFDPHVGPAIIVIDPTNHPQFYVDRIAAMLKRYFMDGKTVTVTVIEGDPSKETGANEPEEETGE